MPELCGETLATAALVAFFAAAGVGKAVGGIALTRTLVHRFAIVPPRVADHLAPLLVVTELLVTIGLLSAFRTAAATLAALLCLSFTYAVSTALARGEDFDCGCLGALAKLRVTPRLLMLDLVMLGASLFLVCRAFFGVPAGSPAGLMLTCGAVAILGLTAQSVRANFFPSYAMGLSPGTPVPDFSGRTGDGRMLRSADLSRDGAVLLFLSGRCPACQRLLADVDQHASSSVRCLVLAETDRGAAQPPFASLDSAAVVISGSDAIARSLGIRARPAAVMLKHGTILGTLFPTSRTGLIAALAIVRSARGPRAAGPFTS